MDTSVIIGLLVIAAVWSVYLLPVVFGDRRDAPLHSTQEFDRWSHVVADVQRHSPLELAKNGRDVIRRRRRRTLGVLLVATLASFGYAWYANSLIWLLVGLLLSSLVMLYVAALAHMKQRRLQRLEVTHVAERPTEWEEPQIRVIAN